MNSKRNTTLNIGKFFAAVGVVMIHCGFPGILGKILYGLSRFGVPFFYMVSGYYFSSCINDGIINKDKLKVKITSVAKIWFITDIVYFIILFSLNEYSMKWLYENFVWNRDRILQFVGLQYAWLGFTWFLFALILCYVLAAIVTKYDIWNVTYCLIPVLLFINLIIGEGLPFFMSEEIPWNWCSNLWVLAFPFFALGHYVKSHEEKCVNLIDKNNIVKILLAGFVINMIERVATHASQLFFSNIFMTFAIFVFCIKYPHEYENREGFRGKLYSWFIFMGESSMFIYLSHPAFREFLIKIRQVTGTEEIMWVSWVGTACVLAMTLLFSYVAGKIKILKKQ